MGRALTREQFIAYWLDADEDGMSQLAWLEEAIGEHAAQFANECAMFGDAGPGQGLRLREMREEAAKVRARLAKFGAL